MENDVPCESLIIDFHYKIHDLGKLKKIRRPRTLQDTTRHPKSPYDALKENVETPYDTLRHLKTALNASQHTLRHPKESKDIWKHLKNCLDIFSRHLLRHLEKS